MATPVTLGADFTHAGGWLSGTNATTLVRANASLATVSVHDYVWNATRKRASWVTAVSVGGTNTTVTIKAITGQVTTDTVTIYPHVSITGYKSGPHASPTTYTALTIGKTGVGWTSGQFNTSVIGSNYFVVITAGTGAGARAEIVSNTTTILTVKSGFSYFNESTEAWEWITPDATSTFAVMWNCADIINAGVTGVSWANATSKRAVVTTKPIHLVTGSGFGDFGRSINYTSPTQFFTSESGSYLQWGRLNESFYGNEGGVIQMNRESNIQWMFHLTYGQQHFAGVKFQMDRIIDGYKAESGFVAGNSTGLVDGVRMNNCTMEQFGMITWEKDAYKNVDVFHAQIGIENPPLLMENVNGMEASMANDVAPYSNWNGGDLLNIKMTGTSLSATWNWQRPILMYGTVSTMNVYYYWNSDFGIYTTLTDLCDWYASPYTGAVYLGTTLGFSTVDSASSALDAVYVGVIKTSDGTGQIMTAKAGSGGAFAPTKNRFIVTDGSGNFTGMVGAGRGIPIVTNKLTYNGSRYLTTNTSYEGQSLILTKYGYVQSITPKTYVYNTDTSEVGAMTADPYVTDTYANAVAYTGFTWNRTSPTTGTITVSGTKTHDETYDYVKAKVQLDASGSDLHTVDPFTTTDGINYTLAPGWTLNVTGSLIDKTKAISGTVNVSSGGFYQDKNGAKREVGGAIHYLSAVTYTMLDVATPIQYVWTGVYDSGGNQRLYNASLTNTEIESDVNGEVTGFILWKIDTTTYSGHVPHARQYTYLPINNPEGVTGTEIIKDVLFTADPNTIEPVEANVSAYTGFSFNYGTGDIDITENQTIAHLSDRGAYEDSLQANIDETIPSVAPAGSIYTIRNNWNITLSATKHLTDATRSITMQGTGLLTERFATTSVYTYEGGTFKQVTTVPTFNGGTLNLGGAETFVFTVLDSMIFKMTPTAPSTYVMGGLSITGTLDLRNETAHAITVELPSGTSYTTANNVGGAITVTLPTVYLDIAISGLIDTVGANDRLQIINSTALSASDWQATTVYSLGDMVLRTTGLGTEQTAGLYMRCTTQGTSGGSEPTWDTTVGNTTADGTVVWTTFAVLYYDADPASTSYADSFVEGQEFLAGEAYEVRFAEMDTDQTFKTYTTTGIVGATGFTLVASLVNDETFATNALDGSAYETTFSPDYTNDYIVLDTNTDFLGTSAYAYYCYLLTSTQGMYLFWGGITALDTGNYRINDSVVSMYFDESAGFVKQTDNVRFFRNDGARPALDPTTGGNGIEINWRVPVNVVSVAGASVITGDIADVPTASENAVAVRQEIDSNSTQLASILTDTGTTIPAQITALNDLSSADVTDAVPTVAENQAGLLSTGKFIALK